MNGDQTLILRMMINLITNAINYGKINGHIHVILKVENDQIVGEVKDDGIGISCLLYTSLCCKAYEREIHRGKQCKIHMGS